MGHWGFSIRSPDSWVSHWILQYLLLHCTLYPMEQQLLAIFMKYKLNSLEFLTKAHPRPNDNSGGWRLELTVLFSTFARLITILGSSNISDLYPRILQINHSSSQESTKSATFLGTITSYKFWPTTYLYVVVALKLEASRDEEASVRAWLSRRRRRIDNWFWWIAPTNRNYQSIW